MPGVKEATRLEDSILFLWNICLSKIDMKLGNKLLFSVVVAVWGMVYLSRRFAVRRARYHFGREVGRDVFIDEIKAATHTILNGNQNDNNNWGEVITEKPPVPLPPAQTDLQAAPAPRSSAPARTIPPLPPQQQPADAEGAAGVEEWVTKEDVLLQVVDKTNAVAAGTAATDAAWRERLGAQLPEEPVPTATPASVGPGRLAVLLAMHHASLKPGHSLCAHVTSNNNNDGRDDEMKLGLLPCDDYDPGLHKDQRNVDAIELEWRVDTKRIKVHKLTKTANVNTPPPPTTLFNKIISSLGGSACTHAL